jgi:hypothetical protein
VRAIIRESEDAILISAVFLQDAEFGTAYPAAKQRGHYILRLEVLACSLHGLGQFNVGFEQLIDHAGNVRPPIAGNLLNKTLNLRIQIYWEI